MTERLPRAKDEAELWDRATANNKLCVSVYVNDRFSPKKSILRGTNVDYNNLVQTVKSNTIGYQSCVIEDANSNTLLCGELLTLEKQRYRCSVTTGKCL